MFILRNIVFLVILFAVKTARQSFGTNLSTPVKVESVLELNTKVVAYEILHMLTKI
jgi:hypothetical protein